MDEGNQDRIMAMLPAPYVERILAAREQVNQEEASGNQGR